MRTVDETNAYDILPLKKMLNFYDCNGKCIHNIIIQDLKKQMKEKPSYKKIKHEKLVPMNLTQGMIVKTAIQLKTFLLKKLVCFKVLKCS